MSSQAHNPTAKTLIAIRCKAPDRDALDALMRLAGGDHFLCLSIHNEQSNAFATDIPYAHWSSETAAARGLVTTYDIGWRCGDYNFYALRDKFPDFDTYWLIEDDVFFNRPNPHSMIESAALDPSDFLAYYYEKASASWSWGRKIKPYYNPPYSCIFPVTRASGRFIDAALKARVQLGKAFTAKPKPDAAWPNDESFLASLAAHQGFAAKSLEQIDKATNRNSMITVRPRHRKDHAFDSHDNRAYHPVLEGKRFFHKVCKFLRSCQKEDTVRDYSAYVRRFQSLDPEFSPLMDRVDTVVEARLACLRGQQAANAEDYTLALGDLRRSILLDGKAVSKAQLEHYLKAALHASTPQDVMDTVDSLPMADLIDRHHLAYLVGHYLSLMGRPRVALKWLKYSIEASPHSRKAMETYLTLFGDTHGQEIFSRRLNKLHLDFPAYERQILNFRRAYRAKIQNPEDTEGKSAEKR